MLHVCFAVTKLVSEPDVLLYYHINVHVHVYIYG